MTNFSNIITLIFLSIFVIACSTTKVEVPEEDKPTTITKTKVVKECGVSRPSKPEYKDDFLTDLVNFIIYSDVLSGNIDNCNILNSNSLNPNK